MRSGRGVSFWRTAPISSVGVGQTIPLWMITEPIHRGQPVESFVIPIQCVPEWLKFFVIIFNSCSDRIHQRHTKWTQFRFTRSSITHLLLLIILVSPRFHAANCVHQPRWLSVSPRIVGIRNYPACSKWLGDMKGRKSLNSKWLWCAKNRRNVRIS